MTTEPQSPSCSDVLAQLWAYLDAELDEQNVERVRAHLQKCESCFPQYDFQRAFRAFLGAQCTAPAPPGLRQKIFLRLLETEQGQSSS